MQIDREALNKLQTLNDRQLKMLIQKLVVQSGLNPAEFNIDPQSIDSIRLALRTATDEDLQKIADQYEANRKQRG